MSLKDFQLLSKLGDGAYSSVYKVKRIADGIEYALKKVKLMDLSDKEKQNALNEVRILASVRHQNIIGYKEVFLNESTNSLCIIMELCDGGDLFQKITDCINKGKLIEEDVIWKIFIQTVKGLKALHDLKIFHRDLKSANIFLNKDGNVKLGDMNVSKVAKKGLLYTQTGTPYYASPEVWKDQPYDHKSDIWSLGCVLYEMVTLKPPFKAEDMEGLYKKVIKGYYPKIPNNYSQDLSKVIRALLQVQPHMRPGCEKILQFPLIQKIIEEQQFFDVSENNLLMQTIRIPKNLHYLTDRLPKPNYNPLKKNQEYNQTVVAESRSNITQFGGSKLPKLGVSNLHVEDKEQIEPKAEAFSKYKLHDETENLKNIYGLKPVKKRDLIPIKKKSNHVLNQQSYDMNQGRVAEQYDIKQKNLPPLIQARQLNIVRPNIRDSNDREKARDKSNPLNLKQYQY